MVKAIKKRKEIEKDDYIPLPEKIYGQIIENIKSISIGVGAIILISALIWGLSYSSEKRSEEASEAFSRAVNAYWQQVQELNSQSAPENIATGKAIPDFAGSKGLLAKVSTQYKNTVYGKWSELYLGNCFRYEGNLPEAEKHYLSFIGKYGKSDLLLLQAYQKLTVTLVDEEKYEDVLKYSNDYIGKSGSMVVDEFLYRIGVCHEKMNDLAKAQTYFKRVIDEYPESPYNASAMDKFEEINIRKRQGL